MPCPTLHGPPLAKARDRFKHGSVLSGNFCPLRVNSQRQSTRWQSSSPKCPALWFSQGTSPDRVVIRKYDLLFDEAQWISIIGIDQLSDGDRLERISPQSFRTTSLAADFDILFENERLRIFQPQTSDWLRTSEWRDCEWKREPS
jgi:hypothetical protein